MSSLFEEFGEKVIQDVSPDLKARILKYITSSLEVVMVQIELVAPKIANIIRTRITANATEFGKAEASGFIQYFKDNIEMGVATTQSKGFVISNHQPAVGLMIVLTRLKDFGKAVATGKISNWKAVFTQSEQSVFDTIVFGIHTRLAISFLISISGVGLVKIVTHRLIVRKAIEGFKEERSLKAKQRISNFIRRTKSLKLNKKDLGYFIGLLIISFGITNVVGNAVELPEEVKGVELQTYINNLSESEIGTLRSTLPIEPIDTGAGVGFLPEPTSGASEPLTLSQLQPTQTLDIDPEGNILFNHPSGFKYKYQFVKGKGFRWFESKKIKGSKELGFKMTSFRPHNDEAIENVFKTYGSNTERYAALAKLGIRLNL